MKIPKNKKSRLEEEMHLQLLGSKKLPRFAREVFFHGFRCWRFDFANTELKIAIECHGGLRPGLEGRHIRKEGFTEDREKMTEAQLLGWIVIECTWDQIRRGLALSWVERAVELRRKQNEIKL